MPSFGPAFDKTAFDVGSFDAIYSIPLLANVIVPRELRRIEPGAAVFVTIYIQGVNANKERFSLNVSTLPTITIYKPETYAILVNNANMYSDGDVGYYSYQHQSVITDIIGPYLGQFIVVNGDRTLKTAGMRLFELV